MNKTQLRQDTEYLAGNFVHRGACSELERAAANYIHGRFRERTLDAAIEEFDAPGSPLLLFAAYYGEFLVVSVVAHWWPWAAFGYGSVVFVLYLTEFTGYSVLARLLPGYRSQNVVARFLAPRPKWLFVITAHYDSPRRSRLNHPSAGGWLTVGHLVVLFAMLAVLVSCAAQAMGVFGAGPFRFDLAGRWCAVAYLLGAAALVVYWELTSEHGRGAVDNASGVSVLLGLAQKFFAEPLEEADVWIAATGSKETWMSGMRHLVLGGEWDRETTFFLNIERPGAGALRYLTGEGMVHLFRASPDMIAVAGTLAAGYGAEPLHYRGMPTDASIPLAHGFSAMTILGVPEDAEPGLGAGSLDPPKAAPFEDALDRVDFDAVSRAGAFAEAIVRRLEAGLSAAAEGPSAGTQGPSAGTQGPSAGTQGPSAGTQGPSAGTQGPPA